MEEQKKVFSSEARKAGLWEPEKPVEEMTEDELKAFRTSFDPDRMGFDGAEGTDGDGATIPEEETDGNSGSVPEGEADGEETDRKGDGQDGSGKTEDPQADQ